ncbi:Hypothetical protein D9617_9g024800 [Elsinoe fawcettii]|nr:Hypothetical protein D9617_9g024800 [Elsinoe fawcettii]
MKMKLALSAALVVFCGHLAAAAAVPSEALASPALITRQWDGAGSNGGSVKPGKRDAQSNWDGQGSNGGSVKPTKRDAQGNWDSQGSNGASVKPSKRDAQSYWDGSGSSGGSQKPGK